MQGDDMVVPIEQQSNNLDRLELISNELMILANTLLESKLKKVTPSSSRKLEDGERSLEHHDGIEYLEEQDEEEDALIALATPLFTSLKSINRDRSSNVSMLKSNTQTVRNQVDQIHLDLQNLIYERRHLEKEIKKCQEFESEYQNISIHSLEEYFERNPEDKPDQIDPHELMIKRLKFELSERKRFESEKKELLQKKLKLSKENDEKKSKLDELEKQLDRFVANAKEIQSKMANQV